MYHVKAWASWADVGNDRLFMDEYFPTERAALEAAAALDGDDVPLIDIYYTGNKGGGRYIADRHLTPFPSSAAEFGWTPRDAIPGALARLVGAS